MADHPRNVLFLCTGNSARSILGEALLNANAGGRFRAFSAGSRPKGAVHPLTLRVLEKAGIPTAGLRSKSWDEFATTTAPRMDFVFTVCDGAAGEACPVWPGQPVTAHWGIEDPAMACGSEADREAAFARALRFLSNRVALFTALPVEKLDTLTLRSRLREIGAIEGSTSSRSDVA